MSYKCTCIKWDFLIALSALLCSDPFCALLYSAPLLLLSLSPPPQSTYSLALLASVPVCLCGAGAGTDAAAPMLLRLRHIVRSRS